MKLRDGLLVAGGAAAAMFTYGVLVESRRLVVERKNLPLDDLPASLDGYKIAFLADFHIRNFGSLALARKAISLALAEEPDILILGGDIVSNWSSELPHIVGDLLVPLRTMKGKVIAIAGNRDYRGGPVETLAPIYEELGISFLRNENIMIDDIAWIGIDSLKEKRANPKKAFEDAGAYPRIVLWHEPDHVNLLPHRSMLQLSGHSHGGQFIFPGGYVPMKTMYGSRYLSGFFDDTATPLYVTRGVGTTFLPARFLCPPEVSILTLRRA